jgi:hypothetical protein
MRHLGVPAFMEIGHADPVTRMVELGIHLGVGSRGARVGALVVGGVTAITASAVFCVSEERVQAPEPRLAISLVPLPEPVEEADHPVGRWPENCPPSGPARGRGGGLRARAGSSSSSRGPQRPGPGRGALIRSPRSPAPPVRSCSCSPTRRRQPQLICSRSTAAWSNIKRAPAEWPMAVTIAARAERSSMGSPGRARCDAAGGVVGERWPLPDAGALLRALSSSTEAIRTSRCARHRTGRRAGRSSGTGRSTLAARLSTSASHPPGGPDTRCGACSDPSRPWPGIDSAPDRAGASPCTAGGRRESGRDLQRR